jgi:ribonuclease P protein component
MNLHAHPNIIVIKKNSEIRDIFSKGKKIYTKYGVFFLCDKSNTDQLRFAVLIKKNVGNAVQRNYCKRIVRTYMRNKINSFTKNGKILFVYTYEGKIGYTLLEQEFDKKLAVS